LPTNPFFNNYSRGPNPSPEQQLLEDLIVEQIQIYGADVWYLPRRSRDVIDSFYGEDPVAVFRSAYMIEMYLKNVGGHEGPSENYNKFLMQIQDSDKFIVARRTFNRWVTQKESDIIRPKEGDWIWVPFMNNMYEIKFVEEDDSFYPLGTRPPYFLTFALKCEMVKYSNELLITGMPDIDQFGMDYAYTISLSLRQTANVDNGRTFQVGETVFQGNTNVSLANTFATVKAWTPSNNQLQIVHILGNPINSAQIVGNTSNASWTVSSYDFTNFSAVLEENADNVTVKTEGGLWLTNDNTDNPFGNP